MPLLSINTYELNIKNYSELLRFIFLNIPAFLLKNIWHLEE